MVATSANLGFGAPFNAPGQKAVDVEKGAASGNGNGAKIMESIPAEYGGHNKPLSGDHMLRSHTESELPDFEIVREISLNFSPKIPENAPTVLSWKDLNVTAGSDKNAKVLLNQISGSITGERRNFFVNCANTRMLIQLCLLLYTCMCETCQA
jgi:hypothetical protein